MPLEGHYERQTTPLYKLSARELRVAVAIVAVTVAAVVGLVAFSGAANTNPAPPPGCINPTVAGIVGAETLNACGQKAVDICSRAAGYTGARAETIVADCERQAVRF
ncbi:MAG: hypothetical protein JSU06_11540 [Actinobacteria bacterium]|nr:hypothetical protein [Actinomycetota bacterium]